MDQDLLPEGMTSRRWAATSANTRRRKSTGPKRSVALGRQLPGAVNMKPGTASSTYSRRLRWSQLTFQTPLKSGFVCAAMIEEQRQKRLADGGTFIRKTKDSRSSSAGAIKGGKR